MTPENKPKMTHLIQLYGTPQCRRYKRMRQRVLQAMKKADIPYRLEEITDSGRLSRDNPLRLPRLVLDGREIAVQNVPTAEEILRHLSTLQAEESTSL
ncbi:MAG TPA: thioredoxin family protein [Chloroflexi bacterium]|nr:thioredoxin family protein [Chloroflexota bacterium]